MDYNTWIGKKVLLKYNYSNCPNKDTKSECCDCLCNPIGDEFIVEGFDGKYLHDKKVSGKHMRWPCRCVLVEEQSASATSSNSMMPSNNGCPRCNGKLIKKEAEEPFTGKKYMIDKCQDCGWC